MSRLGTKIKKFLKHVYFFKKKKGGFQNKKSLEANLFGNKSSLHKSAIVDLFNWRTHLLYSSDSLHTSFDGAKEVCRIFLHSEPIWRTRISILNRKGLLVSVRHVPVWLPSWDSSQRVLSHSGLLPQRGVRGDSGPEITLSAFHNNTAVDTVQCQELSRFWFSFLPLSNKRRPDHLFRLDSRG